MPILGIGVDLLHTARIKSLVLNSLASNTRTLDTFARRTLSPNELAAFRQLPRDPVALSSFLSLRWAAKEAVYKAMYPIRLRFPDITVEKVDGKPVLRLEDAGKGNGLKFHMSASHDGEFLVATVVVEST